MTNYEQWLDRLSPADQAAYDTLSATFEEQVDEASWGAMTEFERDHGAQAPKAEQASRLRLSATRVAKEPGQ